MLRLKDKNNSFFSLLEREVMRFVKNPTVTVAPPIISQILYVIVFGIILGSRIGEVGEYSYISFMFPGLIMMALLTNAYLNPSWSLFSARHHNWIEPIISSPLGYLQIVSAYIIGGIARGLLVGGTILALGFFLPVYISTSNLVYIIVYMILVAFLASTLGCLMGLWAEEYDQIVMILDFLLFPLIFLGGVFYSIEMIEGIWILELFVELNPITYMIDGLRYGIIGLSELNTTIGLILLITLSITSFLLTTYLFIKGYGLRE
ncbi:ABC transporter [archaeon SCG-AAA382B04]|nr:ABC transporter [archaeon SCG-AAA382B04]